MVAEEEKAEKLSKWNLFYTFKEGGEIMKNKNGVYSVCPGCGSENPDNSTICKGDPEKPEDFGCGRDLRRSNKNGKK